MKSMASAVAARKIAPNGRYPFNITAASAGFTKVKNEGLPNQKGGDSCIELSLELAEGEYAGNLAFDTLGTDGGTNFGAMSKKKLRALDVQGLDSDAEIPDEMIAGQLLNKRVWCEVERQPQEQLNSATNKWEPIMDIDETTGLKVPRYKLKIIGYVKQPAAQQLQGAPVGGQQLAPPPGYPQQGQQMQMPPQGYPQAGQLPPGYPTQQPAQGGFPGQTQLQAPVQGGFPGQAPQGYAMPPGGFPQVQAPPGWVQQPQNGQQLAPQGPPQGVPGQQPFPGFPGGPPQAR